MKLKYTSTITLLLTCVVAFVAEEVTAGDFVLPTASVPNLYCDHPVYDFGTVDNLAIINHVFLLHNRGNAPLAIAKVTGCCGASTDLKDNLIQPGSNTSLTVTFALKGRLGRVEKPFYVESNDPSDPFYRLTLVGATTSDIDIQPATIDFGALSATSSVSKTVDIVVLKTNTYIRVTNLVCTIPNFAATLCTREPGRAYQVVISNTASLPPGITQGEVKILTDDPKLGQTEITVLARLSRDIVVVPNEISLSMNAGEASTSRAIILRSRTGREFKIVEIKTPGLGITSSHVSLGQGMHRITLLNLTPTQQLNGQSIVIVTDNSEMKELTIPIRVF